MKILKFSAIIICLCLLQGSVCISSLAKDAVCKKCGWELIKNESKEPSCTEDGNRQYTCCSNPECDYTTLYDTYGDLSNFLPRLGHLFEDTKEVKPTCTQDGRSKGRKCTRPGCGYEEYTVLTASGHTEITVGAKEATCLTAGNTGTVKCKVCDATLKSGTVIQAKGHSRKTTAGSAPGCVNPGKTEGVYCSACGEILTAQKEIPATGHRYGEGKAEGYAVLYTCLDCGHIKTVFVYNDDSEKENSTPSENVKDNSTEKLPDEKPADTGNTVKEKENDNSIATLPSFMEIKNGLCRINAGTAVKDTKTVVKAEGKAVAPSETVKTGCEIILPDGNKYTVSVPGDTDCDGTVTVADARTALRQSIGLEKYTKTSAVYSACDFDGNGSVTVEDARKILRKAIGLE